MKIIFIGINGIDLAYTRVRCYGFARLLASCGYRTEVFTLQEEYYPGIHPDYMLVLPRLERLKLTFRAFSKLWKEKGALFYIQKAHYHAAAPFLLSRLGRNRYVLDYDDWDLDRSPFLDVPLLDRCIFGASGIEGITANLARSALACVASTEPLRELLSAYGGKVSLIPTVTDTDKFRPSPRDRGTTTFIWNGMVWGEVIFNNVMFLADCFKSVWEVSSDVRLLITGKGGWYDKLRNEISARYGGLPIEVRGWTPPDEMPSLLAEADVGLMPLIPDPQNEDWMRCKCPTKLFEFMAMGMPSVVSDFGEARRIIDSGGDGFLAADRGNFIRSMKTLAGSAELRSRMGEAARRKAVEKFSFASQKEKLFSVIAAASPAPGAVPGRAGARPRRRAETDGDSRLTSVHEEGVPDLGPEVVWLDLTNRCALRCISCWNRSPLLGDEAPPPEWHEQELPFDAVIRLVDDLAALHVDKLWISGGGDPLLYRKIFEVIGHAKRRGMKTVLTTSLSTADERTVDEILRCGLDDLVVSLWAATPRTYAVLHPGSQESLFEKILGSIRLLTASRGAPDRPHLVIDNIIMNLNYREFVDMVDLAVDLGARDVWFNTMDVASKKMRDLLLNPGQIEELLHLMMDARKRHEGNLPEWQGGLLDFTDFREKVTNSQAPRGFYHTDIIDDIDCYAGWYMARVLAGGDVCPCCKADRFPVGNILKQPFGEIWRSPQWQEFRLNARKMSKFDSYFKRINCPKVCDTYWMNKAVEASYREFISGQRPGL